MRWAPARASVTASPKAAGSASRRWAGRGPRRDGGLIRDGAAYGAGAAAVGGRIPEEDARFRGIADQAPVVLWTSDAAGGCTYLNGAWYAHTGQTEAEAMGFGWLDRTHPDERSET